MHSAIGTLETLSILNNIQMENNDISDADRFKAFLDRLRGLQLDVEHFEGMKTEKGMQAQKWLSDKLQDTAMSAYELYTRLK